MTEIEDRLAALSILSTIPGDVREQTLEAFERTYRNEPLALDKWLAIQSIIPENGTLERIKTLMEHRAFSLANPNRARSLIGTFAMGNLTQFHRADGTGYEFLADFTLALDAVNPQVAARILTAFGTWRTMEPKRRDKAQAALKRLLKQEGLSRDVTDIAQRSLGS